MALAWGLGALGAVFGQQTSESTGSTLGEGAGAVQSNQAQNNAVTDPNSNQNEISISNTRGASGSGSYVPADEESLAFPGGDAEDVQPGEDEDSSAYQAIGLGDVIRMVLVLVLVILVIYGLYYLLKRLNKPQKSESGMIALREQTSLGGSRNLYLVEVGNQIFLLGASDSSFQLLTEITDDETKQEIILNSQKNQADQGRSFSALLSRWLPGGAAQTPDGEVKPPHQDQKQGYDFLQNQRERLKKW